MVSNPLSVAPCKYSPIFAQIIELPLLFLVCSHISQVIMEPASSCVTSKAEQVKSPEGDGCCVKLLLGVTGLDPRSKAESGACCLAGGGGRGHDPAQDSG